MEKLETTKEFVLEAHQAACQDWKRKIEKEFPSLFEVKPITGKWFKLKDVKNHFMAFVTKESPNTWYGVDYDGDWFHNIVELRDFNWGTYIEATPQEVEQMLWKEAEKRGIGKDTKCSDYLCDRTQKWDDLGKYTCSYNEIDDELWNKNGCVYKQGKFAITLDTNKEIKETIERLEKELAELKEKVK